MDEEQKWQNEQYIFFKQEWISKWSDLFPQKDDLKEEILKLQYDNFYCVNNAFGKLDKALSICDFLYQLTKSKPPQDTEKIIITTLVSCAEAVYRINKPDELVNENLVKGFFNPVKEQLNYKIRGHVGEMLYQKVFEPAEILYLVRNDYIHNGNFTGRFFRRPTSKTYFYNSGCFYFSTKESKTNFILANSECSLTYKDFLNIFLEAFIKNIEKYLAKKAKTSPCNIQL
ncbi:hypothetical protein HYV57_01200 [Candidatus Peregrinibacteria bacterium]|nr:hypothetical protein [Candidatus Peregrinibacteria bacterium]